jgi:hypothetical protein
MALGTVGKLRQVEVEVLCLIDSSEVTSEKRLDRKIQSPGFARSIVQIKAKTE